MQLLNNKHCYAWGPFLKRAASLLPCIWDQHWSSPVCGSSSQPAPLQSQAQHCLGLQDTNPVFACTKPAHACAFLVSAGMQGVTLHFPDNFLSGIVEVLVVSNQVCGFSRVCCVCHHCHWYMLGQTLTGFGPFHLKAMLKCRLKS